MKTESILKKLQMFLGRIQIKESERSSRRRRGKLAFEFGKRSWRAVFAS